jgi:hypothetical protein
LPCRSESLPCVSINAAIEFLVSIRSLVDLETVAEILPGFALPFHDEVAYFFTGACPLPIVKPLSEKLGNRK